MAETAKDRRRITITYTCTHKFIAIVIINSTKTNSKGYTGRHVYIELLLLAGLKKLKL